MMAFVIDASMTLAWCVADEHAPNVTVVLDRLERVSAIAMHFWGIEVRNARVLTEKRGRMSAERMRGTVEAVISLDLQQAPAPDALRALEIIEPARA